MGFWTVMAKESANLSRDIVMANGETFYNKDEVWWLTKNNYRQTPIQAYLEHLSEYTQVTPAMTGKPQHPTSCKGCGAPLKSSECLYCERVY